MRLGCLKDAPRLAELQAAFALEVYNESINASEGVSHVLSCRDSFYVVYFIGVHMVGCLRFTHQYSDWKATYGAYIDGVYVSPEYRRQGVCKKMLDYAIDISAHQGCTYAHLYIARDNAAAACVYGKSGFMQASGSPVYFYEKEIK